MSDQYVIKKCNHGYLVTDLPAGGGYASNKYYAFSTLKEAQEYLPNLFEPEKTNEND